MQKRLLLVIACTILVLSYGALATAATVSIADVEGEAGASVEAAITLDSDIAAVGSIDVIVTYDAAVLTATAINYSDAIAAINPLDNLPEGQVIVGAFTLDGVDLVAGTLFTIAFDVNADVAEGTESEIVLTEVLLSDVEVNDIAIETSNGKFIVPAPPPENQPPEAVIAGAETVDVGVELALDASGSADPEGGELSFAWDFGDGEIGEGATVTHAYAAEGEYTITLTVTDDQDATATATKTVTVVVPPPPAPMIAVADVEGEAGSSVEAAVTLDSDVAGVGSIDVIVTYDAAVLTATAINYSDAIAAINPLDNLAEAGKVIVGAFTLDGVDLIAGTLFTIAFDVNADVAEGTESEIVLTEVLLSDVEANDIAVETSNGKFTLITPPENQPPEAIIAGETTVTVGTPLELDASGSTDPDDDPLTFEWSIGEEVVGTEATLGYTFDVAGEYVITLKVMDDHDNVAEETVTVAVTEKANEPPAVVIAGGITIKLPASLELDASGSTDPDGDPLTFEWSIGEAVIGTEAVLSHTFDAEGEYVITLKVMDDSGNVAETTVTVMVKPENEPPVIAIAGETTIKLPASLELDASGSTDPDGDPLTFEWSIGEEVIGTEAALSYTIEAEGEYVITLKVMDDHDNVAEETVTVTVVGNETPVAVIAGETDIEAGMPLELDASGSTDPDGDPLTFEWSIGEEVIGTEAVLSYTIEAEGEYVITLKVMDDHDNVAEETVTVIVAVKEEPKKVFLMDLVAGLNMISLPLKPVEPYSARALMEEPLAGLEATVVIKLDEALQSLVGFTKADPGDGFAIEGGKGYIVNVKQGGTVSFVGDAWETLLPEDIIPTEPEEVIPPEAAPSHGNSAWAFVLTGVLEKATSNGYTVTARNLQTGAIAVNSVKTGGHFNVVWADLNRRSVISEGYKLEIAVRDAYGKLVSEPVVREVSHDNIMDAFVRVRLTQTPQATKLLQNYPNPFNPETWIPFQLDHASKVTVTIYNSTGQIVTRLHLGYKDAGYYWNKTQATYWGGKNSVGEQVASGLYFYHLQTDTFSQIRRMLIVR